MFIFTLVWGDLLSFFLECCGSSVYLEVFLKQNVAMEISDDPLSSAATTCLHCVLHYSVVYICFQLRWRPVLLCIVCVTQDISNIKDIYCSAQQHHLFDMKTEKVDYTSLLLCSLVDI